MYQSGDIRELVQEHHVRFLRLQFTDVFGRFKNIAVPVTELEQVLANQVTVEGSVFTGSQQTQEKVYLHPDHTTFLLFPWRPRDGAVGRLICNGYTKAGARFPGCSRGVLAEVLEKNPRKEQLFVGATVDFFLFHVDERGRPLLTPQDYAGLCDLSPLDMGENARRDMVNTLDEMGIEVVYSHHGGAPGKNRICLKADTTAKMADKIVTAKFVIRAVAQRHGLYASFIPKPFKEYPGAGISLSMALMEEDRNIFRDDNDAWSLSQAARSFAAGIVKHAGALTALCCSSVMSYKRLGAENGAPVLAGLSPNARLTMLNPALLGSEPALGCWIPDALGNPYLILAAVFSAGMEGILSSLELPNLAPGSPANRRKRTPGPEDLPQYLGAAVKKLKADTMIQAVLGDSISRLYIQEKEREWDEFLYDVHQWELERYLT